MNVKNTNYSSLLSDVVILKISGAIFISTIAMAILEPCLPIWLMANMKPEVENDSIRDQLSVVIFNIYQNYRNGKSEPYSFRIQSATL